MKSKTAKFLSSLLFIAVALVAIGVDWQTKHIAVQNLSSGKIIHTNFLNDFFTLKLTYNKGASFSFGESSTFAISLVSIAVVIVLTLFDLLVVSKKSWHVALGLVVGGAIGNLIDRFTIEPKLGKGAVIDFISYGNFFIGNAADIFAVLGAMMLLFLVLKRAYR
jgi:signal peptidase II